VEAAQLSWIPLGALLVRTGLITSEQLELALAEKESSGQRLGEIVLDREWVTPAAVAQALAKQYGLRYLDLSSAEIDMDVARLLPEALARRYGALPLKRINANLLLVGVEDPTNVSIADDLRIALDSSIQFVVIAGRELEKTLNRLYRTEIALSIEESEWEIDRGAEEAEEIQGDASVPMINLINSVLHRAIDDGASDIHFEPDQRELRVRARVDGVMRQLISIPRHMQAGVISRLKVMADLDIAERRLPQDGRVSVRFGGTPIDIRIAVVPTTHGEQAVLRIFQRSARRFSLDDLGMQDHSRAALERAIHQPHGAVIVCGPTGSGKTTTLYGSLAELTDGTRVLQTIEDPVEHQIPGVVQVEVNPKTGLSFAKGLRALLRSDPDVILVGEIRDEETARIAAQASMTGHLVLSSLHAHSAASALTRLKDMGVEPELLATSLNCIIAQRLVRTVCDSCREQYAPSKEDLAWLGVTGSGARTVSLSRGAGCADCANTGYNGRTALFEMLPVQGEIRQVITASTETIFATAVKQGMTTLRQDGIRICLDGVSSLDEVRRVTGDRAD
jgi:type IV pilus assembly protein PilB